MKLSSFFVCLVVVFSGYEAVANHFHRMAQNLENRRAKIQEQDNFATDQALQTLDQELASQIEFLSKEESDLAKAFLENNEDDPVYRVARRYFTDLEALNTALEAAESVGGLNGQKAAELKKMSELALSLALRQVVFNKKENEELTETEGRILTDLVNECS